jgi:predicted phage terminase large subunit-like protein
MDALLARLIDNKSWTSLFYKAHKGFYDFSDLLWSQMWPEKRLRAERQVYIDHGFPEGYSQEYLNNPVDQAQAYFRKDDLLEMDNDQRKLPKNYYAGVDFAISDADRAAYTAIVVGGMDGFGRLHIVDVRRFRGATDIIIDEMFACQRAWNVEGWFVERGAIYLSLQGELYRRMMDENVVLNLDARNPVIDKRRRARSIQGRTRVHGVYFDKNAAWYPVLETELTHFPKGTYNDQVDALAWLGLLIHGLTPGPTEEELEEEAEVQLYEDMIDYSGISEYTGY